MLQQLLATRELRFTGLEAAGQMEWSNAQGLLKTVGPVFRAVLGLKTVGPVFRAVLGAYWNDLLAPSALKGRQLRETLASIQVRGGGSGGLVRTAGRGGLDSSLWV